MGTVATGITSYYIFAICYTCCTARKGPRRELFPSPRSSRHTQTHTHDKRISTKPYTMCAQASQDTRMNECTTRVRRCIVAKRVANKTTSYMLLLPTKPQFGTPPKPPGAAMRRNPCRSIRSTKPLTTASSKQRRKKQQVYTIAIFLFLPFFNRLFLALGRVEGVDLLCKRFGYNVPLRLERLRDKTV